ncbi:MAG: type II secretion system F family protein [Clostridia bacterium]|nr:type II secretion system F family protein [Clostridia bacterium]MBQ8962789.1 type II secretion system F family protein [Clostridia bacterium]
MATYNYSALTRNGKKVNGVIDGFNELDAVARIKENYPIVVKLEEAKEKSKAASFLSMDIGGNKLDDKAFTLMCSQFSVILKAGVPIRRTVELIADKMTDKTLKRVLGEVAKDVEGGRSLAASFADRGKKLFPVTFLETVRAGEESGSLDSSFESVSEHYAKQTKMKGKVKGALAYPAFVMVVAVVVVIVLMAKVVPTFTAVFADYGAELPVLTQMLIGMSNFFRKYWLLLLGAIAAIILLFKLYGNTESGRLNLAKLQLKLPILGNIAVLNGASQFANTMAMMLRSGLPMTKAVTITSRVLDNYFISQQVGKITGRLEEGHTLGASLRDADCLPDILVDMTAVGEESGELNQTLSMTAEYYDSELEQATAAALAKLEPAVLVFLAAFAGFIVLAIYMAMFGMYAVM